MKNTFLNLSFPFVYLDSSFLLRTNNVVAQKLTRTLLSNNPQRFHALLDELVIASKADRPYYEQIIDLQHKNIISTVITFEALNFDLISRSPGLIPLFGSIHNGSFLPKSNFILNEDLVLWGENVNVKTYTKASMAILNSRCIVADNSFLSLTIGKNLAQHITSDSIFYILSGKNRKQNFGDNSIMCELPPKNFIQLLHSQL